MSGLQGDQLRIVPKNPCRVATTSNVVDLASGAPDTVDGVGLSVGDRILVHQQSTGSQNGIYVVDVVGTGSNGQWSRALDFTDAATNQIEAGVTTYIQEGTFAGGNFILTTTGSITVGTTALTFSATVTGDVFLGQQVVLNSNSSNGIQVDQASPVFPWRNLKGALTRMQGTNEPLFNTYVGGIRQYQFFDDQEIFVEFEIPHDYALGSDLHLYFAWSQTTVDTGGAASSPGDVRWNYEVLYAKGHNQGAFPGSSVTGFATQTASGTVRQNMHAEVQLSAGTPSGSQIDSDNLEPDGMLLVRVWRNTNDAEDTLDQAPFLHAVGLHYRSTNIGTKNKAPNFYS